jgi:hypothetical protein
MHSYNPPINARIEPLHTQIYTTHLTHPHTLEYKKMIAVVFRIPDGKYLIAISEDVPILSQSLFLLKRKTQKLPKNF